LAELLAHMRLRVKVPGLSSFRVPGSSLLLHEHFDSK